MSSSRASVLPIGLGLGLGLGLASVLPIGLLGLEWLDERVATPPPLLSEPPALLLHTCIGLIGLHGLERLGYEDGLYVGYDDGRLMVRVGSTESARLA